MTLKERIEATKNAIQWCDEQQGPDLKHGILVSMHQIELKNQLAILETLERMEGKKRFFCERCDKYFDTDNDYQLHHCPYTRKEQQ